MGKTLVTGATGFTGWNLCKRLVLDGEKVAAFVRPGPMVKKLKLLGVECRVTDITDPVSVGENFDDIDRVYHIAAAYRTEHSDRDEFNLVNVGATRNLLEAAAKAQVKRFVHCSTVGVQGEIEDPPADENYRFRPGDHYQESKLAGELIAREYFGSALPVSVVRPVGIYGPGDTRFLKLFRPINRGLFVMIGSGEVLYHMTFIDDLVDGIILCGTRPEAVGEVFTIGGGGDTTLRELCIIIADVLKKPYPKLSVPYRPVYLAAEICEKVCRLAGINPPLYPRRVEFFALDRAFSIKKAGELLGYQPKVGLREGVARTAEWYKSKGLI
ncbi:MAG: NAD-dependent epimerase/dehydratase family protein [Desulfobacteraceae bacterium]|nr:NAD-dependent epimerase/dehydratase family protein [Desulfobacteraceae bacterium]